jgi:outer membrane protein assembly factor BamB
MNQICNFIRNLKLIAMHLKTKLFPAFLLVLISVIIYSFSLATSGWPQFRGMDNNMIAPGTSYPTEWNDSLNVKWTYNLDGESWSSPIVSGDKIFFTSVFLEKAAPAVEQVSGDQKKKDEDSYTKEVYRWELTCLDSKSGKELWKQVAYHGSPKIKKHSRSTYACETPVADNNRVYAYFGMTGVFCYDLNGKPLWQKDLGVYKTRNDWGTGSSPVIYQDKLFIQVDNEEQSFLVALDAATGAEKWRVNRDEKTNYSTPVIWKNQFQTELVTVGRTVRAYNPETGALIWELKIDGQMAVSSPVYDSNHIYLGRSGENSKPGVFFSIKAGAEGDITPKDSALVSSGVEWTLREAGIANASPLLYDGLLYLVGGRSGELSCVEASSGALIYKQKIEKVGACWASPWTFDDKIYFYDEKGITQVVQAGKEFKLLSQNTLDDKFWASVAFTGDAYILKGVKKIYCISK